MFVRSENPIWYMVDLTGTGLDDRYYIFFLTNTIPPIPQAMYQDPNGITLWSNPIQFQPSGTLPDNLYFDPNLVYTIQVRKGPDSSYPLIWEILNYVPGSGSGSSVTSLFYESENQIINPQFSDIYFTSPLTYTQASPGTYTISVGPGWNLILTGSGTTVLTQNLISGANNLDGNPPTSLTINNSGWSSATLQQVCLGNGAIFANGAVSMSVLAEATTSTQTINLTYSPSGSTNDSVILLNGQVVVGSYNILGNAVNIPASINSLTDDSAYVDFNISLPGTGIVSITNVQVLGQSVSIPTSFTVDQNPLYIEQTPEQQINQEFAIYKDPIFYKQIPSYLVGWDFPLNPYQFYGPSVSAKAVGANKSYYAWDQTIVFQSVDSGATIAQDAGGAFQLNCAVAGQFAIIQYLPSFIANKILNDFISINLAATSSRTGGLPITISLWYTTGSLPSAFTSNNSIVATIDANGKPATFNGNWTEVTPLNGQEAIATVKSSTTPTTYNDYSFNGYWNLNGVSDVNNATFFAIVIGTSSMSIADSFNIYSVGLCSGQIATRPSPQTDDEVLRECQYYYEKSYDPGVIAGTVTNKGVLTSYQDVQVVGGPHTQLLPAPFGFQFNTVKYATATVTFYSPASGSSDLVLGNITAQASSIPISTSTGPDIAITSWNVSGFSQKSINFVPNTSSTTLCETNTSVTLPNAYITYHYIAYALLGQ